MSAVKGVKVPRAPEDFLENRTHKTALSVNFRKLHSPLPPQRKQEVSWSLRGVPLPNTWTSYKARASSHPAPDRDRTRGEAAAARGHHKKLSRSPRTEAGWGLTAANQLWQMRTPT